MASSKAHQLMGAGAATLIAEPALAMAHQGGLGIIVGLVIGAVAYGIVDEVEQRTDGQLALPVRNQPLATEKAKRGSDGKSKPNLAHRLLVGKSVREEADNADADEPEAEEEDLDEEQFAPLDTLEMGDLRAHVDTVFSNRLAILGMSGSGKSNLVAVLTEELGQFDAPLIVLDHKPEYWPLCKQPYLIHPAKANAQNLSPRTAFAVGQDIMQRRLQVVVDLTTYRNDAEAALVMTGLIDGVTSYQQAQPDGQRIPCTFVLDEAHYWLPQQAQLSTLQAVKHPQTGQSLLSYLEQKFFNMAKLGRYLGMGLVIATQRPAAVNKELISQANWRFLLQVLDPADLKVYREYGIPNEIAQALDPKRGDAYVIGPDGVRGVYHIRRRASPDVAKSPGLANIRNAAPVGRYSPLPPSPQEGAFERESPWVNGVNEKRVNGVNAPFTKPVNGGDYSPPLVNAVTSQDAPEPSNIMVLPVRSEQKPPPSLQDAIVCWNELIQAGQHPSRQNVQQALLAKGFDCKEYWARKFIEEIQEMAKEPGGGGGGGGGGGPPPFRKRFCRSILSVETALPVRPPPPPPPPPQGKRGVDDYHTRDTREERNHAQQEEHDPRDIHAPKPPWVLATGEHDPRDTCACTNAPAHP